ncbi:MAG TPA: head GIN domain-containing protein, partial [Mucilaginibacter sp.]|nr:head GIN domain-containing protein [Mucilaginibacter sp.]
MKRIYSGTLLLAAVIAVSLWSSCRFGCIKGSGNKVTNDTKVGNFSRISVSGAFKVNLKQDSTGNVSVTADDNLQKYIHVESDGDELHIYSRKNFCNAGEMVINIGLKQVERIKGSGAVEFISDGKLNTGDLRIGLSGASKVDLDLTAANVQIDGSGASEIDLKGQATSNKVELTGEGKVSALDFVVGSYDIHTTGASHCDINVLNSLNVNTTGASEIRYRGNPSNVNSSKTGASTLT